MAKTSPEAINKQQVCLYWGGGKKFVYIETITQVLSPSCFLLPQLKVHQMKTLLIEIHKYKEIEQGLKYICLFILAQRSV